jgi:type VI secretion system protein ImpA
MAVELEQLIAPVSETDAVGPDLAYDPERQEIEQAFETSAADGDSVDWRKIVQLIEKQSARTKDIWLAVYLCRAGARWGQIALVETGAAYLAALFERYWDVVHPTLDEYGFQGRKGPCEGLTRIAEFLGPLRGMDFERFRTGAEAEDGYGLFRAALQDIGEGVLSEVAGRLSRITASIRAVDAVLTAKAEGDTGANFSTAYEVLAELQRAILAFTTAPAEPEEAAPESVADAAQPVAGPRLGGRVESREDVLKGLDAIADYYRRKEPTSPVPMVLQRARDWVTADFMTVLQDIAPGGLDEARRVLVSRGE